MEDQVTTTTTYPARTRGRLRRWLSGGMLGLTLAAVLLGGTAVAQTEATDTGESASFLERLAGKFGMTADELVKTIKDTRIEMVDEAVENGRLTVQQGDALKQRIESADGSFLKERRERAAARYAWKQLDIDIQAIATQLQMTADGLRAELESGATLEEVIIAQGLTVDVVVAALVADAGTTLAVAVADGDLTQAQADRILTHLPDRLTRAIEHGPPDACERWFSDSDTHNAAETSSQL